MEPGPKEKVRTDPGRETEKKLQRGGGAPEGRKHVQATVSSPDHSVQMQ